MRFYLGKGEDLRAQIVEWDQLSIWGEGHQASVFLVVDTKPKLQQFLATSARKSDSVGVDSDKDRLLAGGEGTQEDIW